MGKPFATELERIPETLAWAASYEIGALAEAFSRMRGEKVITIGAGGSFTVAELVRLSCEARGDIAQAHTPLSFLQCQTDLRGCHVVLFTASGNNRDTLAAYRAAVEREAKHVLVLCGSQESKVARFARDFSCSTVAALPLPTGKDGYLATNSLLAFSALALRAMGHGMLGAVRLAELKTRIDAAIAKARPSGGTPYFLVLYSVWGRVAAVDFESKFHEAGIGAVQYADYRQFGHGRHNWIDKQGSDTTVVALVTPEVRTLACRTLSLLPHSVRVVEFESNDSGPIASLELLLWVFYYTEAIGRMRSIDPGRPGVPRYGSRIYRLGPLVRPAVRAGASAVRQMIVHRKLAARASVGDPEEATRVSAALERYMHQLREAAFGALVCDFDGTVVDGGSAGVAIDSRLVAFFSELLRRRIPLFFATGRGDSIHEILCRSFPAKLLPRLTVYYYNGAFKLPMSDAGRFESEKPHFTVLDPVFAALESHDRFRRFAIPKHNGCQITVKLLPGASSSIAGRLLSEIVGQASVPGVRILFSSHSMDVLPAGCSKLNAIRDAEKAAESGSDVLAVGDRGAYPGNDFEFLTHRHSISVDTVSSALESCWNLLPAGVRNVSGLVRYVSMMDVRGDRLRFQPSGRGAP